jgi:pre-mRNA-splicing factor SYF1
MAHQKHYTCVTTSQALTEALSAFPALLHHEEDIGKTPYQVSSWLAYLEELDGLLSDLKSSHSNNNKNGDKDNNSDNYNNLLVRVRDRCGRRAVKLLPKSYKLWKYHWEFIIQQSKTVAPERIHNKSSHNVRCVIQLFECALVTLHPFPRVWIEYLNFVHTYGNLSPTKLRRLANRALEALPVTQHDKIWPVLLQYYQTPTTIFTDENGTAMDSNTIATTTSIIPPETKVCMLRRYLQFNPLATKQVADFLSDQLGRWGEAAVLYKQLLDAPEKITIAQRQELWMSLAKICTQHSIEDKHETHDLDWDAIVRGVLSNLSKYLPDAMEGFVWNQLADWWIRRGEFQLARSVYEEALEAVSTVRDFTILLDAYLQFEEGLLEATMANQLDDEEEEDGDKPLEDATSDNDDWDILLPHKEESATTVPTTSGNNNSRASSMTDLELALARGEELTARRPLLLNRVLLKQSPHDVSEWLKRAKLFQQKKQPELAAAALEEALQTVHARRAVLGNPSQIVIQLSTLYEQGCKDISKARDLFDRICEQHVYEFKFTDDLADCYAAWVEFELRQEAWDNALDIVRRSVVPLPRNSPASKNVRGLFKSSRLWDLLFDLEESLGTVQTTKDAYNRALEQKVATPVHVLNFASFLTEHKYFEESFTAYERGVELFQFPAVKAIWKSYLDAFLKRFKGNKMERTRDLFQRCIEACPPEECSEFFIMNGEFEEQYGLTKRALGVYQQLCVKVPPAEKYTAYQLFIAKTTKYMGLTATREIYQAGIEALTDDTSAAQLCLDFAKMETSLQEMDRARAILTYGAQMADPRRNDLYWKTWNAFEVAHGNEETFREMLRVKRSVEASFSTVNYNAAEMNATSGKVDTLTNEEAMRMIAEREGVEMSNDSSAPIQGFVSASTNSSKKRNAQALDEVEERVSKLRKAAASATAASGAHGDDNYDDEIDIDEEDDDGEGKSEAPTDDPRVRNVSTKSIPAGVFGGLAANLEGKKEVPVGALERLRAAAQTN